MKTLGQRVNELKGSTTYTLLAERSGVAAYKISRIARGLELDPNWLDIVNLAHLGFGIPWKIMLAQVDDEMHTFNPYIVSQHSSLIGNGKKQRLTVEVYPVDN